jgi:tellurite resistance protein TerC
MDNVFVIALIFQHLRIPTHLQHRVLFWGILGALAMRGAMIGVGAALVARYHWVLYLFGAFLVYTGIRMLLTTGEEDAPGETWVMRRLRRTFPITEDFHGSHFTVKLNGRMWLTPLAVALVLVETTDLIFAVDSIPAIFAITADPFLVFTSNVFAILCLRSLYFGLAGLIERFKYLKVSLSVILALVGVKMLTSKWLMQWFGESLNFWMLGLVAGILLVGAVASGRDDKPPRASAT